VVELILRDVDVGDVVVAAEEKVRQNHPVDRLMADNHDIYITIASGGSLPANNSSKNRLL